MLHTIYISCGPHGFREKYFKILTFSHYKSTGANHPRGVASLDPKGLIGRIYVSSGPHGFTEEDFFKFFLIYKSMGANYPRGMASF